MEENNTSKEQKNISLVPRKNIPVKYFINIINQTEKSFFMNLPKWERVYVFTLIIDLLGIHSKGCNVWRKNFFRLISESSLEEESNIFEKIKIKIQANEIFLSNFYPNLINGIKEYQNQDQKWKLLFQNKNFENHAIQCYSTEIGNVERYLLKTYKECQHKLIETFIRGLHPLYFQRYPMPEEKKSCNYISDFYIKAFCIEISSSFFEQLVKKNKNFKEELSKQLLEKKEYFAFFIKKNFLAAIDKYFINNYQKYYEIPKEDITVYFTAIADIIKSKMNDLENISGNIFTKKGFIFENSKNFLTYIENNKIYIGLAPEISKIFHMKLPNKFCFTSGFLTEKLILKKKCDSTFANIFKQAMIFFPKKNNQYFKELLEKEEFDYPLFGFEKKEWIKKEWILYTNLSEFKDKYYKERLLFLDEIKRMRLLIEKNKNSIENLKKIIIVYNDKFLQIRETKTVIDQEESLKLLECNLIALEDNVNEEQKNIIADKIKQTKDEIKKYEEKYKNLLVSDKKTFLFLLQKEYLELLIRNFSLLDGNITEEQKNIIINEINAIKYDEKDANSFISDQKTFSSFLERQHLRFERILDEINKSKNEKKNELNILKKEILSNEKFLNRCFENIYDIPTQRNFFISWIQQKQSVFNPYYYGLLKQELILKLIASEMKELNAKYCMENAEDRKYMEEMYRYVWHLFHKSKTNLLLDTSSKESVVAKKQFIVDFLDTTRKQCEKTEKKLTKISNFAKPFFEKYPLNKLKNMFFSLKPDEKKIISIQKSLEDSIKEETIHEIYKNLPMSCPNGFSCYTTPADPFHKFYCKNIFYSQINSDFDNLGGSVKSIMNLEDPDVNCLNHFCCILPIEKLEKLIGNFSKNIEDKINKKNDKEENKKLSAILPLKDEIFTELKAFCEGYKSFLSDKYENLKIYSQKFLDSQDPTYIPKEISELTDMIMNLCKSSNINTL